MKKYKDFLRENVGIVIILILALYLRLVIMNELGVDYSLESDDLAYIKSGRVFLEEGTITMHRVLSAQIMPGMTFFISFFGLIFGTGYVQMVVLKIVWTIMGLTSILYLYKIVNIYASKFFSCLASCFLLALDFAWIDNLILTETPFMLVIIMLIYNSLLLAETNDKKHFWYIVVWYIIGVFIRPNIGIYPIFLIIYLLLRGYDKMLLFKQTLIAGGILLITLTPWTIRNYYHFERFIPLTYGAGNPLLLGTYQGHGFPDDKDLDYKTNVDEKMSEEMYAYIYEVDEENDDEEKKYMRKYYWLEQDKYKAKYRMQEWWKRDPKSMIYSYAVEKPLLLLYGTYSIDMFDIPKEFNLKFRDVDLALFGVALVAIIITRKRIKETVFLLLFYASQIALYSYTYAFARYGATLYCIRFIIIGIGLYSIYSFILPYIKKKLNRNSKPQNNLG